MDKKRIFSGVPIYNSYHTELKCLARENLLAWEISAMIPRSNVWRWKHEPADKYKTFDLNLRTSQDYELIKTFSQNRRASGFSPLTCG